MNICRFICHTGHYRPTWPSPAVNFFAAVAMLFWLLVAFSYGDGLRRWAALMSDCDILET
jgi:hypothetical protein